ncbi:MAG: chemotaxis protein CheW [Myxococcota bacterium]
MVDAHGHLIFSCGPGLFAVPADTASEIVTVPAVTRVPGAPAFLLGVFAHRGELLPLFDLARLTGDRMQGDVKRAVLLRLSKGAVALTAGRVLGIVPIAGALNPVGESGIERHLRGPVQIPQGLARVIDTQTIVEFLAQAD